MSTDRFRKQLAFIEEIDKVKQIIRQCSLLDESRQENDAEHSWHMAVAMFLFQEYANDTDFDMVKAFKMVLIHDIVEIDAGDTFAYDEAAHHDKEARELKAAHRIFGLLPDDVEDELKKLWLEFEEGLSKEARYVTAIDRFMPLYHNYRTKGKAWLKHGVTAEMVLTRNANIKEGSVFIWEEVVRIVADAKQCGYLAG